MELVLCGRRKEAGEGGASLVGTLEEDLVGGQGAHRGDGGAHLDEVHQKVEVVEGARTHLDPPG